jgi:hypothetical protein
MSYVATINCNGRSARTIRVVDHPAGEHPDSPIRNDIPAREWITTHGSRWSGIRPDGQPAHPPLFI